MRKMQMPDGKIVNAEVVDFYLETPESTATYKLMDGTVLKIRLALSEVVKLVGEYAPNGEPLYQVYTQTLISSRALLPDDQQIVN